MTRWLEAARQVSTPTDLTDLTHLTHLTPEAGGMAKVKTVKSVKSGKGEPSQGHEPPRAEIIILSAIRAGNRTPGAIATATRIGATAAYQALDRMRAAGLVEMARDGAFSLAGGGSGRSHENNGLTRLSPPENQR